MNGTIKVFGKCPTANPAEHDQFIRVTNIIAEASDSHCDWAVMLRDFNYCHTAGDRIEFDKDWNGQFDILVLTEHKIIIYELKAFTASILYGTTGPADWRIQRLNAKHPNTVSSYFIQVSKQRAYLLQDYLQSLCSLGMLGTEEHFVVDARLVFRSGSDLSGFFHRIPMTANEETFESNILSLINSKDDRQFVRDVFSERECGTGKLKRRKIPKQDYERLKTIFASYEIHGRTTKWFKVLTEERITEDFGTCGSDGFSVREEDAIQIAEDIDLKQEKNSAPERIYAGSGSQLI